MRLKRTAAVVGLTLAVGAFGGVAGATQASGTATPNVVPNDGTSNNFPVTLNYTSTLNNPAFISLCRANFSDPALAPTFDVDLDCGPSINPTPTTANATIVFNAFRGDEPLFGAFGCGPRTSVGGDAVRTDTCYIRISPAVPDNRAEQTFIPLTYSTTATPPTNVPEVPLNVLLPVSAAAVLGGGLLIARKRSMRTAS